MARMWLLRSRAGATKFLIAHGSPTVQNGILRTPYGAIN